MTDGLVVYSRSGCHICEEALAELESIRGEYPGLVIDVVDIERDDELHRRYLERIPVVVIGGEEVSDLVLDIHAVRSALDNP